MRWGFRRIARVVSLPPLATLEAAPLPVAGDGAGIARKSGPARATGPADELDPEAIWTHLAAAPETLAEAPTTGWRAAVAPGSPRTAYDRFRREAAVRPPPGALPDGTGVTAIVDGSRAAPFLLRETLRSLQDQSVRGWRAIVLAPPAIIDHPVGSFADTDPRIAFAGVDAAIPADGRLLLVTAGTRLDPEALAWLLFASDRTGASATFADHDHGVVVPGVGPVRSEPWLYWTRDRAMLPHVPAPALVLARADLALKTRDGEAADGGDGWRRRVLLAAEGAVPHVPRLLATLIELPPAARGGRAEPGDAVPGTLAPVRFVPPVVDPPAACDGRIAVIVPTRDGGDMLVRAIDTLHGTARAPDRLDVIVADNRSSGAATAAAIAGLHDRGLARRLTFDQPFNWALINNLAVAECDAPTLVFANDDIEMSRYGWDDILLAALDDLGVGAVGTRLLYPDRTVQHGGMVFGLGPGHPEHEGRAAEATDEGPGRRLVIPRDVAAVTGAFLGCRRAMFDSVGGFDAATMFVGHSDVDFCLKVREAGGTIRYEPKIEAIHHESVTRGRNVSKAQVAWDEGERGELIDRWGTSLTVDPGVDPYWAKGGIPFEGYREPPMSEIVAHIDLTGAAAPWRPSRRVEQEAAASSAQAVARG